MEDYVAVLFFPGKPLVVPTGSKINKLRTNLGKKKKELIWEIHLDNEWPHELFTSVLMNSRTLVLTALLRFA